MGSITHTKVTDAPADPTAIVDGPAWDAAHTFSLTPSDVGLGNVPNVNATNADNIAAGSQTGTGAMVRASAIREKLAANRTYYVRSDGSDSNNGLTNSAGGAFLTWANALFVVTSLIDFNNFNVTITNGNAATFTTGINVSSPWVGGGQLFLDLGGGAIAVPGGIALQVTCAIPTVVWYQNGTLSGGIAVSHSGLGVLQQNFAAGAITYGACTVKTIQVQSPGALIQMSNASFNISGGSPYFIYAVEKAAVECANASVTFTGSGTYNFSSAFVYAWRESQVIWSGATFSFGSVTVTGKRYQIESNSVIDTGGSSTFLPGSIAGTTATGGRYINETASATLQASPPDPTGATTEKMMGLAVLMGTFTPLQSTRVMLAFQGQAQNASGGGVCSVQARWGTGTAPTNGAATTGTTVGSKPHSLQSSANEAVFFYVGGVITGLTVGTAYWFDLAVSNIGTGTTASVSNVSCSAYEF